MRHVKKLHTSALTLLGVLLLGIGIPGCGGSGGSGAPFSGSEQEPTQRTPYTIVDFRRSASTNFNATISATPSQDLSRAEGRLFHTGNKLTQVPKFGRSVPQSGGGQP